MNRPLKPRPAAAKKPTREALAVALAEKERALAEALARQAATTEVLRVISRSSADEKPVFESIALAAMRLLHCDVAGLFGCDECVYWTIAGANPQGLVTLPGPSRVRIDPAASFPARAIASRQVLHIPDWSRVELPEVERRVQEQAGLNSTLYLPMLREDRCVGLLVFGSSQANNFGPSEIALAESFRDQASIAIENTRLFNEAKSRTRDLEESLQQQTATADVLKVISRSVFDVQAVLDTLVESAARLCGAGLGLLYLAGEDAFECKALAGMGTAEAAQIFKGRPIRAGRGTAAERVIMTGEVHCVEDFFADPEFDPKIRAALHAAAETGSGIANLRSTLAVPMKRGDCVVGVIAIARAQAGPFPQRQVELLQTFADQAVIAIENARLFAEVQAKTRDLSEALVYQTGSGNILKVIAASPTDVAPVLQAIVDSACEVCGGYDAAVLLKNGDDLKFSAHRGPIPIGLEGWPISRRWVGGRAFVDQRPVHVHDLMEAGEEFPDGRELARRMGHRTILAVPLIREGESIGAIVVRRNEIHPFTDKQIALLQTFADQAVIAIGNVRLFDEVQARTHDLSEALEQQTATAEVLKVISRSVFDLETVLQTLIDTAVRLGRGSRGTIFIRRGDVLVARAFHRNVPNELRNFLAMTPWRIDGDSDMARAVRERKVVHIPDLSKKQDAITSEVRNRAAFGAALWVPLMRDGEAIGLFGVPRDEPIAFTEREIEIVKTFSDQAVIAVENARLFDELQARTRDLSEALQQQTATAEVLKVISRSAFDLDTVLTTLVESAQRLCNAQGSMIFLRDGDVYRIAECVGMPEAFVSFRLANPLRADRLSAVGRVALTGEMVHLPDVFADPDIQKTGPQLGGFRAMLSVPLVREREVVGIFALNRPEPGAFSPGQVKLVQTFADQAAIAIANVRLFNEVKTKTDDLSEALQQQTATADVLKVISRSAFDLQAVLDTLVESAVSLIDASSGVIWLRDGDVFNVKAASSAEEQQEFFAQLRTRPQKPGRSSIGARVLLTGEVQIVSDIKADQEYDPVIKAATNARALLGVPLLRDGVIIGAFVLALHKLGTFTARQIDLVQTFADQAVIAIENARLFDEVQARTRELSEALQQQTATADVLKVISRSAFDLQTVLDTLVASAATLCEAEKACIFQRQGDLYHWVSNFGFSDELVAYAASHPFREGGNSTTSRVARDRRTVHVPDVLADPDYTASEYQRLGGYRTMLGVPLLREGAPIGVFIMTREAVRPFNDRQIDLLQTFADQAVIAIENVRLFDEVQARTRELAASLDDLRKAQDRLVQSEKLASLGQLTAGIAHEIKNPLNFINNFSALSRELIGELGEALGKAPLDETQRDEAEDLIGMIGANLDKVVSHGKRADSIVKNMLLHSREGSGERSSVNINAMVEEALNLAYHGARAERAGFNVTIAKSLDPAAGAADLYGQEMTRVLLNLISNGFYATTKRRQGEAESAYEPTIIAKTRDLGDSVEIIIRDNGTGIAEDVRAKMFNPFFTTKPAGEGTGLGLSLSHDIVVKQHGGTLEVTTELGAYTQFTIVVPRGSEGAPAKAGAA